MWEEFISLFGLLSWQGWRDFLTGLPHEVLVERTMIAQGGVFIVAFMTMGCALWKVRSLRKQIKVLEVSSLHPGCKEVCRGRKLRKRIKVLEGGE